MRKLMHTLLITGIGCFVLASCGRHILPSNSSANDKIAPKVTPDRPRPDREQYVKKATIIDSNTVHQRGELPPAQNNHQEKVITDSYNRTTDTLNTVVPAEDTATATYLNEPVVVIDSRGNLMIDSTNLPPTVSHNLDSLKQAIRAFTPDQAKNLAFRFKQIPPRVLFVPDELAKQGRRGFYYKYNDQFWYWKQADGFFYLDENYYK